MKTNFTLLFIGLIFLSLTQVFSQAVDITFRSGLTADDIVYTMEVLEDGKILVGGTINASNTDTSKPRNIARLNADGSRDDTFGVGSGFNNLVRKIAVQDDGKILVGGSFSQFNGIAVNKLARLNADGTLDETFPSNLSFINSRWYEVSEIQVTESEDIFIGGTGNWQPTSSMLKKLDSNGIEDITFKPPTNLYASIYAIEIEKNNKILVGGEISTFSNYNQNLGVIRINQDGSIDSTFTISNVDFRVNAIKTDKNDKVYVGGQFEEYNGQSFSHLVRLDESGNIDNTFQVQSGFFGGTGTGFISGPLGQVRDIDFDDEGRILVSGSFIRYQEEPVYGIARLNSNGSLESSFTGCGEYQPVATQIFQSEILSDGSVISGGWITNYDGIPSVHGVVKLTGDVSSNPSPIIDFDVIIVGRKASFVNKSQHAFEYEWNFGNWWERANVRTNPVHIFDSPGRRLVSLTGKGFCGKKVTVTKEVTVFGVSSVYPNMGGNDGLVTITLTGHGFTPQTKVQLVNGSKKVNGVITSINPNADELQATFLLENAELGMWDVEITENSRKETKSSFFEVQESNFLDLSVDVVGPAVVRSGRPTIIKFVVNNHSNNDVFGVPVWISNIIEGMKWQLDANLNTDEIQPDVPLEIATGDGAVAIPILLTKLGANGKQEIELTIEPPVGSEDIKLDVWVNKPIIDLNSSKPIGESDVDNVLDCFADLVSKAFSEVTEIVLPNTCRREFIDLTMETIVQFNKVGGAFHIGHPDFNQSYTKHLVKTAEAMFNCSGALLGGRREKLFEIADKSLSFYFKTYNLIEDTRTISKCTIELVRAFHGSEFEARIVAAFDPNEKVGPINTTENNYTQGRSPFTYTVFFENVDSASAAAQEVIILDTLNSQVLDLSTFMLTGYGYGNERYKVPTGLSAYSNSYPLLRTVGDAMNVRFDGYLNPETGVVKWRFLSVNPATGELIDDPIDGFLPPNKNPGEGEGYVTFSIMPKQDLPTGTRIENKALIYFDFNEPIITNTFLNAIDKDSPESRVTALQPVSEDTVFTVFWSGEDAHAGIRSYDVLVSVNEGPFGIWQYDVSHTSAEFTGHADTLYRFYSIAKDHAGNREGDKDVFEAETRVVIQSFAIEGIETNAPTCTGDDSGRAIVDVSSKNVTLEYSLNNSTFQDSNSFIGLAPGSYRVYVRDKANTENKLEEEFTIGQAINESPPIPIISINGNPGISEELSLVSSSTTGNQWFKDGVEIPGATGQSIMVNEAGTYQVRVTGSGGCSSSSELTAITSSPEVRTMTINLFPNPAINSTNIRFGKEAYIDRVVVYSVTGVLLQETLQMMSVTNIELDLSGLSAGTYVVLVQGNGILERLRLIKN